MKKQFSFMVAAMAVLLAIAFQQAAIADETQSAPGARASEFYTWYIKNDSDQSYPLGKQDIYGYVAKGTVNRLRNDYKHGGPPNDEDYFLKSQDYDTRDWLAHIETRPAVMLGTVVIIPVTFGSKDKVDVLVFMKKQFGHWKITKVDDTQPYQ